jgi:hypothetical protein
MVRWWHAVVIFSVIGPANAGDLALERIMLSSGGVGYFEYQATVDGDATLSLDVPLDQVDDILKSLVVYDDHGTAGEITLPGREPLTQSFVDLPFDHAALASAPALLNALQGAEVRVTGAKPMNGRLLRVVEETSRGAEGLAITRNRVTLVTDAGIEQVILEDAGAVAFADPELQKKVVTALSRLASYRADGRRRLVIASHGSGKRAVRVGYVVGVPLWKASYRLSLPADPRADHARVQGWAILENFSGQDWHDVSLTLLSGNPVTFRQALFESYYVKRPSVPVEVAGRVLPKLDTGGIGGELAARDAAGPSFARLKALGVPQSAAAPLPEPPPPAPPPLEALMPGAPAQIEAAEAAESVTQTVFTLPYKVSVTAGQSLVLPILDRRLPASRIDLYQYSADQRHPLAAIALANDGETALPPGVLTLYEETAQGGATYLGDARLAAFPPAERRMLSYAADAKVTVDRSSEEQQAIVKAAIGQGVMRLTRRFRQVTTYRVKTASAGERRLLIEHPRLAGWSLAAPDPTQVELSADAYRIPVTLTGGKPSVIAVTLERPLEETIGLLDLADDRLGVLIASNELEPSVKNALGELASRRQALARQNAEVDKLKEQRRQLVEDEKRMRDNLVAVGHDTALYKQTLDRLGETEATITNLSAAIGKGTEKIEKAREQLQDFVSALTL